MRVAGATVATTWWWMSAAAAQGPPAACNAELGAGARIAECLFGHTEQLSPACKAALESRPHLRLTPGAAATPLPTAKP